MDISFPVTYTISSIHITANTLRNIYNALVENISGEVGDPTILPSSEAPNVTGIDFSPRIEGDTWYVHSGKNYVPTYIQVGDVTLSSSPTVNRTQYMQNLDGIVALLDDIDNIRDTVILPEGNTVVDCNLGSSFKCVLSPTRKTLFNIAHSVDGMETNVLVVNQGTTTDVVWDASINWPGVAPSMPHATPNTSVGLLATFYNIGGVVYGESQSQTL